MKRRELQALCRQHGLAARGSNADLAASLAGTLSGVAAAGEKVVEVVVGKGCLKRSGSGVSGGSSGAAKRVTFVLEENMEAGEALPAAAVSGRDRRQKHTEERIAGEVGADAPVARSMNTVNLRADSAVESANNLADDEEVGKVVGAVDSKRKQKRQTHENAKDVAANVQARVSRRSTGKSISSAAAESGVNQANPAEAREEREWIGEAVRTEQKQKTRVKHKTRETLHVAAVSEKGRRRKRTEEHGGDSSAEGVIGEVGADALVTRSKMNAVNLSGDSEVESQNVPAEAEEQWEVVREAVDSKRKQRICGNAEDVAANAHAGISCRNTRSSSLSAGAVLLCPVIEKKRGRRRAGDCKDELGVEEKAAEVQRLATAASAIIVESKRSRKTGEDCDPAVRKLARVEVSGRVTRSSSVNAAVMLPVVENERRKTEDVHLDREAPTVSKSDVPRSFSF